MIRLSVRVWLAIIGLFWGVSLFIFPAHTLQTDDASMYAAAVRNAVEFHYWVLPTLDPGSLNAFLDKPPLGIWLLSLIPKWMGFSLLSIHITNGIVWLVAAVALFGLVQKGGSRNLGRWSSLIMMSSIAAVVYSRTPKLEMLLLVCLIGIHWGIWGWAKTQRVRFLYMGWLGVGAGFLIKTGFALVLPGLTAMGMLIVFPQARRALGQAMRQWHFWGAFAVSAGGVAVVLGIQAAVYPDLFGEYLRTILWVSKYNQAYLGLGFHGAIIGFVVLGALPWVPFLTRYIVPSRRLGYRRFFHQPLSLDRFSWVWFGGHFLFLLWAYQQVDFRTVVMVLPPLAILSARVVQRGIRKYWMAPWPILLGAAAVIFGLNTANPGLVRGIGVTIALFICGFWLLWMFQFRKLALMALCAAYAIFFAAEPRLIPLFSTAPSDAKIIMQYRRLGDRFIIFRPHDRPLKMRNDLCYEDVCAGPADAYVHTTRQIQAISGLPQLVLTNPEARVLFGSDWQVLLHRPDAIVLRKKT